MADTELYDRLGVSRNAPDSEIKKAYHRLARQYHPDKNPGHENKFKEIQEAYEVLSDPDRKATYDRFGMAAVNEESGSSFGGSMFTESLFSSLFGGDMFGGRRRRSKAETIGIPLEVTLEELYNGTTKSVEYKRKVQCRGCSGTGGKHGSVVQCRKCRGSGTSVSFRPLGPGMVQQIQSTCGDCGGTGDFIREKDRCKKCKGKRVVEVDQKLEVPITPGMRHEQKIPFRGQADELPDMDAGDVIVILQQLDHMTFQRVDEDLFVKRKISLKEALCGFSQTLDHLDGRKLLLACQPGEVIISPGTTKGIAEEGMPGTRHAELKGNLYIEFDVEFPESGFLEEKDLKKLEALLPSKPDEPVVDNEAEEVDMIDFEGTRGAEGGQKEAYHDSDDDDDEPRGGMGCAHQ